MSKLKTITDFIKFFKSIPTKNWIVGQFNHDSKPYCHCALGHLMALDGDTRNAASPTKTYLQTKLGWDDIYHVNDGVDDNYKQRTPKARVLAYLKDQLKKRGSNEIK